MEAKKEYNPQFKLDDRPVHFSNIEATRAWLGVYTQLGVTMRRERIELAKKLDQLDQRIEVNHKDVTLLTRDLNYYETRKSTTGNPTPETP